MKAPRGLIRKIVENRMYSESVQQWNPFKGCYYDCIYCKAFRRLSKFSAHGCKNCYNYIPHSHHERLKNRLRKTKGKQFIFTVSDGDIAFAKDYEVNAILDRVSQLPNRTFLLQSKNPTCFLKYNFPNNVILDTTIETNRDYLASQHLTHVLWKVSKAPVPSKRYKAMLKLDHPHKFVTIEPILDFDIETLTKWIRDIRPLACYIGYDTGNCKLKEPPLWKTQILFSTLNGITEVRYKTIRKAWYE